MTWPQSKTSVGAENKQLKHVVWLAWAAMTENFSFLCEFHIVLNWSLPKISRWIAATAVREQACFLSVRQSRSFVYSSFR